jgi:hypothetical protein
MGVYLHTLPRFPFSRRNAMPVQVNLQVPHDQTTSTLDCDTQEFHLGPTHLDSPNFFINSASDPDTWSWSTLRFRPCLSHIYFQPLYLSSFLYSVSFRFVTEFWKMDFSLGDFCLFCDRQTSGTAFCSSVCRIKQLDHSTPAESTTSRASCDDTNTATVSQHLSLSVSMLGFCLPPAYDFSIHRTSPPKPIHLSMTYQPINSKLSEQVQNDLKNYFVAFDQTRILHRRKVYCTLLCDTEIQPRIHGDSSVEFENGLGG